MKAKKCDNSPDGQQNRATTVKTADGCEEVRVNMGTGEVTYVPVKDAACKGPDEDKK